MKERILGSGAQALTVSEIALGCMTLGGDYGAEDRARGIALIREAYEKGVRMFDTAELYGGGGRNEELVGEAIAPFRRDIVLATKCGVHMQGAKMQMDSSPAAIRRAIEGSLARLGTDYIDLYYIHRVDPSRPIEEAAETMAALAKEGKIRAWGISEPNMDTLRRAHAVFPVSAIESEYNLMWREPEREILPTLDELGVGLVPYRPLARGFLSDSEGGMYLEGAANTRFDPKNLPANMALREFVQKLAREKQVSAAQLSLAWLLAQRPYIVPIPGTRSVERMKENVGAAEVRLSAEELAEMRRLLEQIPVVGDRYDPESDNGKSVRR